MFPVLHLAVLVWPPISPEKEEAASDLQKMAFGGKVGNQTFGTATTDPPRLNLLRMEEDLSQAHLRLSRCYIEHLDWMKCIDKYDRPQTLFFCDPPYWQTDGYGVGFGFEQYELLADKMRQVKGKMIITINDHPDMQKVFSGFKTETVNIRYTVGGNGRGNERKELIVMNW